jgi:hypothetical protein
VTVDMVSLLSSCTGWRPNRDTLDGIVSSRRASPRPIEYGRVSAWRTLRGPSTAGVDL